MVAEIYWEGQGVKADRPRAYAWMDLAAERQFVAFVAKREKYWAQLNNEEREEALSIGAQLYAEYGDDVALPRLDKRISSERRTHRKPHRIQRQRAGGDARKSAAAC